MEAHMQFVIGPHTSIARGYRRAAEEAAAIGANTFQFFTRNPRGGNAKALDAADVAGLREVMAAHDFGPLLAHAPYTLNMASKTEKTREFAKMAFAEDLERLERLPCSLYNFHPGSHVGQGSETGIALILETLNAVMRPDQTTTVLLETMAGKGSEIGRSFEELAAIIAGCDHAEHLGVCLDTCHVYSAGYDIVGHLEETLAAFDRIVGMKRLRALHINDSKTPFASHKDRHEQLGKGSIGLAAFERLAAHPWLSRLPMFLETPHDDYRSYGQEIAFMRAANEGRQTM
jgi:deoxyribonuclease-4